MPKRLGIINFINETDLRETCKKKGLNEYEEEIIVRVHFKKQSLNFVADTLDFSKYGKEKDYYSLRSINRVHKEAFLKINNIKGLKLFFI